MIKVDKIPIVEAWCLKNVGPRLFHLHTSRGGQGWLIKKSGSSLTSPAPWIFELEDGRQMTMALLVLGDKL
jgi:hypothetical protein